MDVLLIQPIDHDFWDEMRPLPLGLLSISSLLYYDNYKVDIFDQRIEKNWEKKLIQKVKKNPICIGLTAKIGSSISNGLEISKIIKEYNPDMPVVWGGPHPSLSPEQTLQNKYIDFVVAGDGEITFYELVRALEKNQPLHKIKGLWYKHNGKINCNENRPPTDPNTLPDPPYNLIDISRYKITSWLSCKPAMNVITSKGCPAHCNFCYNTKLYRYGWLPLSAERVINLLKKLIENYKSKDLLFQDDNFFVDKKRFSKILKMIINEKLDINLEFQGATIHDLFYMNDEDLSLIQKANCTFLSIGFETASSRILKLMKKNFTPDEAILINKKMAKYNFKPYYSLLAGFPTEEVEDLLITYRVIKKMKEDNTQAIFSTPSLFFPWPGTAANDLAFKNGFVPPNSLEEWGKLKFFTFDEKNMLMRSWLSKEYKDFYKKLVLTYLFVNRDEIDLIHRYNLPAPLIKSYKELAKFRYKHDFYNFMPEIKIFNFLFSHFNKNQNHHE